MAADQVSPSLIKPEKRNRWKGSREVILCTHKNKNKEHFQVGQRKVVKLL